MKRLPIILILMFLLSMLSVAATPLSIVDANYLTFDSSISGPVWMINVRGDNDASYILFGDNDQLLDTVDGDVAKPAEDFSLVSSIESESCVYGLSGSAVRNNIYSYVIDKVANDVFVTRVKDFKDECYDSPGGVLAWGTTSTALFYDVYCLREKEVAKVGVVDEGKIDFNAKFSLQKGDDVPITEYVGTLATNDKDISSSVVFEDPNDGDVVARIRWIGGSTYGETCPGQDNFVAIETSSGWYVANKDSYILYNEQYATLRELISKIITKESITHDEKLDLVRLSDAANVRGSAALVESNIVVDDVKSTIKDSSAVVNLPRSHLIYAPDFQMLLSADWLGVVFQTGKPKIVESGFNSCSESGDNSFFVTVKNIGNEDANFNVGAVCDSGIGISATSRSIKLSPGSTGTVTIPFTVSLSGDSTKSCVVRASDSLKSDVFDSVKISTSCQATVFCTLEGEKSCFGETENICSDGQWVNTGSDVCLKTVCNRDGVCDSKESFELCGGKLASSNDCATCNLNDRCDATETAYSCANDCGSPTPPISTAVYVIGGGLLAVIVFFGSKKIKPSKNKNVRGKKK